ncbi:MAG TPA: heavy-metal-associated domain-containing protein [Gaiellaceae bacterium]|nr:heavy-metal-associated domain-containing protein [Gaiellaceae bacterium]
MSTLTYSVPGVSCAHCKHAIESEVSQVAGVASVEVDVDAKTVTVTGDAPEQEILAAIDEAGYEVATA